MKKGKTNTLQKARQTHFKRQTKNILREFAGVAATRDGSGGLRAHARTGGRRVSLRQLLCPGRKEGCYKREEIEEVYSSNVIVVSHLTKAQHPACSVVLGHACRVRVATVAAVAAAAVTAAVAAAAVAAAARLGCQGYANEDDENEQ